MRRPPRVILHPHENHRAMRLKTCPGVHLIRYCLLSNPKRPACMMAGLSLTVTFSLGPRWGVGPRSQLRAWIASLVSAVFVHDPQIPDPTKSW